MEWSDAAENLLATLARMVPETLRELASASAREESETIAQERGTDEIGADDVMRGQFREFSGGVYTNPRVRIAVVNNRVSTLDGATGKTIVIEGAPKGKGRRRAPYLPIPALVVAALKTQQAGEKLKAGRAYTTCPTCRMATKADAHSTIVTSAAANGRTGEREVGAMPPTLGATSDRFSRRDQGLFAPLDPFSPRS